MEIPTLTPTRRDLLRLTPSAALAAVALAKEAGASAKEALPAVALAKEGQPSAEI